MPRPSLDPKTCDLCGETFQPVVSKRRFCSRQCANRATRTSRKLPPLERTCEVCGALFAIPRSGGYRTQAMCSLTCQRAARYRHGVKVLDLSIPDAAWLAGFMDGEGSILLYRRRDAIALRCGFANTHYPTLEHIKSICGCGAIVKQRRRNPKHKDAGWFQVNAEAAESLIQRVQPYLVTKRHQAELAIWFQGRLRIPSLKADRSWQHDAFARMQALNRRGPAPA